MPLKNLNPTKTKSWKELQSHFEEISKVHMKSLFLNDRNRAESFKLSFEELTLDYSKNRVNGETLRHLLELARECGLADGIEKYFGGDKINAT